MFYNIIYMLYDNKVCHDHTSMACELKLSMGSMFFLRAIILFPLQTKNLIIFYVKKMVFKAKYSKRFRHVSF